MMRRTDQESRVFYELSVLIFNILRYPPSSIAFSDRTPVRHPPTAVSSSSSTRRTPPALPQITPAGFASLLLGISLALMLCGSVTFFIGFLLMPWVLGLVMFFYVVGIVSSISMLGRAILNHAVSPPTPRKELNGTLAEGQSMHQPPLFAGENYSFWKDRMIAFLQVTNYDVWLTIKDGPFVPMENGVEKKKEQLTVSNKQKFSMNPQAINILFCSLDANEYSRASGCKFAKEMWNKLQVTHEGTSQVKPSKINALMRNFELFRMEETESIQEMYIRFNNICNHLSQLGKPYSMEDRVRKVLRSLIKVSQPVPVTHHPGAGVTTA